MAGIAAYGVSIPRYRLKRGDITCSTLGVSRGKGTRSVAGFDEDTTTLGVAAARSALRAAPANVRPSSLALATSAPAYADKTNATAVHAALNLDADVRAIDITAAVRSGIGALSLALEGTRDSLVVLSDIRTGLPGGADERDGGDGAAAFVIAVDPDEAIAEVVSDVVVTEEFLERWRLPGEAASQRWEEHFGEEVYVELGRRALEDALKAAGITADELDHLAVSGSHLRAAKTLVRGSGARPESVVPDLVDVVGNTGAAHTGLLLATALDRAEAGQWIALVVLADGAHAVILRTTDRLPERRAARTVADEVAVGTTAISYTTFLAWRGLLATEAIPRPAPTNPMGPAVRRVQQWKFGCNGTRCQSCSTRHVPPQRVCQSCGAVDDMAVEPLADVAATVVTATVDRLAWSPSPPAAFAVIDLDGGGRMQVEMTEAGGDELVPGLQVEMVFRRIFSQGGVHNYFWKARPMRTEDS